MIIFSYLFFSLPSSDQLEKNYILYILNRHKFFWILTENKNLKNIWFLLYKFFLYFIILIIFFCMLFFLSIKKLLHVLYHYQKFLFMLNNHYHLKELFQILYIIYLLLNLSLLLIVFLIITLFLFHLLYLIQLSFL